MPAPGGWKHLVGRNDVQIADQSPLDVSDDQAPSCSLPTKRFKPRVRKAVRRIVGLQLQPGDRQKAVGAKLFPVSGGTAQAGERGSQRRCPGFHGVAGVGHPIVLPAVKTRNSKPRSNPPSKPTVDFSSAAAPPCAPGTQAAPRRVRAAPRPGPADRSRSARSTHARCSRRRRSPGSTGCRSRRRCPPAR